MWKDLRRSVVWTGNAVHWGSTTAKGGFLPLQRLSLSPTTASCTCPAPPCLPPQDHTLPLTIPLPQIHFKFKPSQHSADSYGLECLQNQQGVGHLCRQRIPGSWVTQASWELPSHLKILSLFLSLSHYIYTNMLTKLWAELIITENINNRITPNNLSSMAIVRDLYHVFY